MGIKHDGTYVYHPVGYLAHTKPGGLTQLFFLILTGVWMVRMTMQPILEIVCHGLWKFPSLSFWPFGHGSSRSRKRRGRIQGGRVFRSIRKRIGLRILRESPGI